MTTSDKSRANWSTEIKKVFIDLCMEEVHLGGKPSSNLKQSSWKKVVDGFNEKRGLKYDQRQLRNQWDIMKKQHTAWLKLTSQTEIGYNDHTHAVVMSYDRWEDYLKVNPDAKVFRTKPLQFPAEMTILYEGTSARGTHAWTPASGGVPDDVLRESSSSHNFSFDRDIPSPELSKDKSLH